MVVHGFMNKNLGTFKTLVNLSFKKCPSSLPRHFFSRQVLTHIMDKQKESDMFRQNKILIFPNSIHKLLNLFFQLICFLPIESNFFPSIITTSPGLASFGWVFTIGLFIAGLTMFCFHLVLYSIEESGYSILYFSLPKWYPYYGRFVD